MELSTKTVLVTGGSEGLGLGLVEMLQDRVRQTIVVARDAEKLARLTQRFPRVQTLQGDVTDQETAERILAETQPDVLVLNAGAKPPMGRLDEISWADFTENWNVDVKAALYWFQAALNSPLRPGSKILVLSSGAAENGSPLSGGYAGAKRMVWIMAKYANGISEKKGLGLRFQALLPMQMVGGTGVGDAGSEAYAAEVDITPAEFLERFGAPMPPTVFGMKVIEVLENPKYDAALAFGLRGGAETVVIEEGKR